MDAGSQQVSVIKVNLTFGGGLLNTELGNFSIYEDINTLGVHDGETAIVTGVTPTATDVTFTGVGQTITSTAKHYLVTYDFTAAATSGRARKSVRRSINAISRNRNARPRQRK